MIGRAIIRCRNCELYDPNPQIVDPKIPQAQRLDPNMGFCRAKLPKVDLVITPNGPAPYSYQPPMHKDGGCAEGEPKVEGA